MVVGVDVSSHAIHLAWLEAGKPHRWHQNLSGGKHDNELIDRLRRIRIFWPEVMREEDTTHIAIEYPYARGDGIPALWSAVGIITRQAPTWAEVAWVRPTDLRAAIGARNTKTSAHTQLYRMYAAKIGEWDEHELDALTACIGWTRILEAQE